MHSDQEQTLASRDTCGCSPTQQHPHLVLVLGGARSGKSMFAERLAASSGRSVAFIATATAGDDDMRARIARHRASRPADWTTIEEPLNLASAVRQAVARADVLLLDCMTLWLSNWMMQAADEQSSQNMTDCVMFELEQFLHTFMALGPEKTLIVVTNEVGLGIIPAYPLGRAYRDTLGWINQRLACEAHRVYLMIAGLGVDIKRLQDEVSLFSVEQTI